jgi:hypothetical protein
MSEIYQQTSPALTEHAVQGKWDFVPRQPYNGNQAGARDGKLNGTLEAAPPFSDMRKQSSVFSLKEHARARDGRVQCAIDTAKIKN